MLVKITQLKDLPSKPEPPADFPSSINGLSVLSVTRRSSFALPCPSEFSARLQCVVVKAFPPSFSCHAQCHCLTQARRVTAAPALQLPHSVSSIAIFSRFPRESSEHSSSPPVTSRAPSARQVLPQLPAWH